MIIVGLIRGIGGYLMIHGGNKVIEDPADILPTRLFTLMGTGLIIVFIIFSIAAYLNLSQKNKIGWILSWIAIVAFLIDGVFNGFILFGKPKFQGQLINIIASLLIAIPLILSKITINKRN
jgi:hypothetical protein